MNLERLLYAKTHEWAYVENAPSGGKIATVGISAFALEALADLVFLNLPEVASSAELVQLFEARWTPTMLEMHLEVARHLPDGIRCAFGG